MRREAGTDGSFSNTCLRRFVRLVTIGDFQSKESFPSVPAPPRFPKSFGSAMAPYRPFKDKLTGRSATRAAGDKLIA